MGGLDKDVVFILGASRSGSTVFASALATQPNFAYVGETWQLWASWLRRGRKCGCGARLSECPFWASVIATIGVDPEKLDRVPPSDRAYREAMSTLYDQVRVQTGAKFIVDSSKDPKYLSDLYGERIDAAAVHMVRDPRGVITSHQRGFKKRGEITPPSPSLGTIFQVLGAWQKRNYLVTTTARRTERSLRVRYEDFVANPQRELLRVAHLVDPEVDKAFPASPMVISQQHVPTGNPSRYESGSLHLEEDDDWKRTIPPMKRGLVYLLGLPQTAAFRYPVF
jgi:hypothetical protein